MIVARPWFLRGALVAGVGLVLLLGVVASLLVYQATERVAHSSDVLTQTRLPELRSIAMFRADLLEHERLAYELYAVIDAERMREPIRSQRSAVEAGLVRVGPLLAAADGERLRDRWAAIVTEVDRLSANIARDPTDWDEARAQLRRISEQRRAVDPVLDRLADTAEAQAGLAEERNRAELTWMSSLVTAYSALILLVAGVTAWMLRGLLAANARNHALAQFPERNPMPVLTLDASARVQYANRSARRWVAEHLGEDTPVGDLVPGAVARMILQETRAQPEGRIEQALGEALLALHWYWFADRNRYHVYIRDITAERNAQRRLERMAFEDEVTGLLNRNALLARLGEADVRAVPRCLAVLSIERFYLLPNSQGFDAADAILARFAQRLRERADEAFGEAAVLARVEGAMFALCWPAPARMEDLEQALEHLLERLPEVVRSGHHMFRARYRMGVRWIPADERATPEALFSDADAALRHGEAAGGARYVIHNEQVREQQQGILVIEERLREAMGSGARGLSIHLQPKVDMRDQRIVGAEALLRWEDPELGTVSPGRFVPIAEQSGLIVELGQWVVGQVLELLASWRDDPVLGQVHVALNAAPEELQCESYSEGILQGLHERGIVPERLEVEITERVLADARAIGRMDGLGRLRRAGVGVSLDDFGTGYSSLGYLASMPVSQLKIDKRFVDAVPPTDASGPALAGIIVNLAEQLGLACIAEGVESAEQAAWLQDVGCYFAQGYHYARPLPIAAFVALVRNGRGAAPAPANGQT